MLGNVIKTLTFSGSQFTIDRAGIKSGIYFVQIASDNKNITNQKIVIQ
jgi:hypothetical protein